MGTDHIEMTSQIYYITSEEYCIYILFALRFSMKTRNLPEEHIFWSLKIEMCKIWLCTLRIYHEVFSEQQWVYPEQIMQQ